MDGDERGVGRQVPLPSREAVDPVLLCAVAALARGRTVTAAASECNVSPRSLHRRLVEAKTAHAANSTIHLVAKFVRAGLV